MADDHGRRQVHVHLFDMVHASELQSQITK